MNFSQTSLGSLTDTASFRLGPEIRKPSLEGVTRQGTPARELDDALGTVFYADERCASRLSRRLTEVALAKRRASVLWCRWIIWWPMWLPSKLSFHRFFLANRSAATHEELVNADHRPLLLAWLYFAVIGAKFKLSVFLVAFHHEAWPIAKRFAADVKQSPKRENRKRFLEQAMWDILWSDWHIKRR